MKRFLLVVMILVVTAGLGWAASPQVTLTRAKQTHQQVRRHRAHRAARHRNPNRHRHSV